MPCYFEFYDEELSEIIEVKEQELFNHLRDIISV